MARPLFLWKKSCRTSGPKSVRKLIVTMWSSPPSMMSEGGEGVSDAGRPSNKSLIVELLKILATRSVSLKPPAAGGLNLDSS